MTGLGLKRPSEVRSEGRFSGVGGDCSFGSSADDESSSNGLRPRGSRPIDRPTSSTSAQVANDLVGAVITPLQQDIGANFAVMSSSGVSPSKIVTASTASCCTQDPAAGLGRG